jgi:hypothetical protein
LIMRGKGFSLTTSVIIGMAAGASADEGRAIFRLEGEIPEKCEFRLLSEGAENGTAAVGGMNDGFSKAIPFRLDCNVPVKYAVRAKAGAFRRQGAGRLAALPAGFRAEQGYRVRLHIPNFDGGDVLSVPEGALTGGKTAAGDSGNRVPYDVTGTLFVSKGAAAGGTPVAGSYDDTLTVTIEPKGS